MARISAQQQREMRARQRLLKICGASVHENLGIGKAVASARSLSQSRFSFSDRWTLPIPDPELRHKTERGPPKPARLKCVWNHVRYDDASGPRGQRTPGHHPRERAEQPVRVSKQELADRPALGVVRIQQTNVRNAAGNQAQFPPKVPRILNARIHPLRADGAVDVRRIAGEEYVVSSIARNLAMMEMKAGQPCGIAEANPSRRRRVHQVLQFRKLQGAHDIRLPRSSRLSLGPFVRSHGDNAPRRRPTKREEHGDSTAAGKRVDRVRFERTVGFHVAEREILRITSAFELNPTPFSHGAMCPVAPDHEPRVNALLPTIVSLKQTLKAIVFGFERP